MDIFTNSLKVDIHDVDFNGIARTSSIMRYIQAAAQDQLTSRGMSYDELQKMNKAFLLSRIEIEINDELRAYDHLRSITFPANSRGFQFLRCYQLMRGEECVCRAVSAWALIDTKTKGLVRVNDFELGLETYDVLDMPMERMIMPKNLEEVGKYKVTYSDTDQNKHMNNTRYPDVYANFLPLEGKRISKISISYLREAPIGCELTVSRAIVDGVYYFRTILGDGLINSEARIFLSDIG